LAASSDEHDATVNDAPLVFVTVGTDDHPFDRLIAWIDVWRRTEIGRSARVVIQYGVSRPPLDAEARAMMPYADVRELMERASAVVTHGGGGRILMAHEAGIVPLVVARRAEDLEADDETQVQLTSKLDAAGGCIAIATETELIRALDAAVTGRRRLRTVQVTSGAGVSERFGRLVDALFVGEGADGRPTYDVRR
jgi:UDP-N-acetylglucosamine transferase subunit ALG13